MEARGDLEKEDGRDDLGGRIDEGEGGNGQQREAEPRVAPDDGGQKHQDGRRKRRQPRPGGQGGECRHLSGCPLVPTAAVSREGGLRTGA
jgi:hypothetical protein